MTWTGESRDWDLVDPKNKELKEVRKIREKIRKRVEAIFEEIEKSHLS